LPNVPLVGIGECSRVTGTHIWQNGGGVTQITQRVVSKNAPRTHWPYVCKLSGMAEIRQTVPQDTGIV